MTELEYRSHPAISRSELWKMHESPEKFLWYKQHPSEPTPALLFGQLVHKMLLQPESFQTEFVVAPAVDRRTKAGKDEYAAFAETVGDRTIVTTDDYNKALDMVTAVRMNPLANKLLAGEKEEPFFWTDEFTGTDCKCRVDCLTEIGDNLIVVDYKSASDASNDAFMRDAVKYGYTLQAAMYSDGVAKNLGKTPLFVFIVQEKAEPYCVNILQADEAFVEYGYDLFREYLGIYKYCMETDDWYGFMGKQNIINTLSLPGWAKGE